MQKPQMFAQLMEAAPQQRRATATVHSACNMCWPMLLQLWAVVLALQMMPATAPFAAEQLLQSGNATAAAIVAGVDMESLWTVEALVRREGYPVELHSVTTQDGYVLSLQRLPRAGHQPILLVHGLFGGAVDFIVLGRNASLAYLLWDGAYDVWLANCRGSSGDSGNNSRSHTRWRRDELLYWNFSFHQIGVYDLPAIVDYVRSNTSFQDMHYVGHSQGATALLVLAAERAAYQQKLALVQLFAPLVHFRHAQLRPDILELIRDFLKDPASRELGAFLPRGSLRQLSCLANRQLRHLCLQTIFQFIGEDFAQLDDERLGLLLSQFPSGGSVKQLRHYYQLYAAGGGKFRQYDYAYEGNYDMYAAPAPPPYNLSRVRVPIVVHHAANDPLASVADVQLLLPQLPRLQAAHLVAHKQFNHMDFVWAKDVAALLNRRVLQAFDEYARRQQR